MSDDTVIDPRKLIRAQSRLEASRQALDRDPGSDARTRDLAEALRHALRELRNLTNNKPLWTTLQSANEELNLDQIHQAIMLSDHKLELMLRHFGVSEPPKVKDRVDKVRRALEEAGQAVAHGELTGEEVDATRQALRDFLNDIEKELDVSFTTRRWRAAVRSASRRVSSVLDGVIPVTAAAALAAGLSVAQVTGWGPEADTPQSEAAQQFVTGGAQLGAAAMVARHRHRIQRRSLLDRPKSSEEATLALSLWIHLEALNEVVSEWQQARLRLESEMDSLDAVDRAWKDRCLVYCEMLLQAFSQYNMVLHHAFTWESVHYERHKDFHSHLGAVCEPTDHEAVRTAADHMLEILYDFDVDAATFEEELPPHT